MDFQTPPAMCDFMVSLLPAPRTGRRVLEPTPGAGNLVAAIKRAGHTAVCPLHVFAPGVVEGARQFTGPAVWVSSIGSGQYDSVVMNPPFGKATDGERRRVEWKITKTLMTRPVPIVALVPWLMLVNSDARLENLAGFGLDTVVALPRDTFPRVRTQTCIIRLIPGAKQPAVLWRLGNHPLWKL